MSEEADYDFMDEDVIKAAAAEAEQPEQPAETPQPEATEQNAEAAPEPAEGEQKAKEPQEAEKPETKLVPIQALDQERHKRRELQRRIEEMERAQAKPAEAPEPIPDALMDPEKFGERYTKDFGDTRSELDQLRSMFREQQRVASLQAQMGEYARQVRAQHSDYDDAASHVENHIRREIEFVNPGADPLAVTQEVARRLLALTESEIAAERNPAQRLYEYAGLIGYKPAPPPAAAKPEPAPLSNLEKAAQAARSLAGSGGTPAATETTLEDLASMSAFDIASIPEAELKRIMRGA